MRAFLGSLGFLTTIPVGNDRESFESFRSNLWVMPITGAFIGVAVGICYLILKPLGLQYLAVIAYISVEGINHIDGLSDFGDAIFAPKDRRLKALKDERMGTGGVMLTALYITLLTVSFMKRLSFGMIVLSQAMAKFAMLLLLTTTKPLWTGMASYMMEKARVRDLAIGLAEVFALAAAFKAIPQLMALLLISTLYRFAVIRTFGGVNGDIIGAGNCLVFLSGILMAQKW